jgi:hypothetical protein
VAPPSKAMQLASVKRWPRVRSRIARGLRPQLHHF